MSRSLKVNRHNYIKQRDSAVNYKCTCAWCINSKTRYKKIVTDLLTIASKEIEDPWLYVFEEMWDIDYSISQNTKTCPKQVKIDLTKAKQKIKMKLLNAPLVQLAEA